MLIVPYVLIKHTVVKEESIITASYKTNLFLGIINS